MYGYVDESGDLGRNSRNGSSSYFLMCLVLFKNKEDLDNCNKEIIDLKKNLGWMPDSEFHFKRDSNNVRSKFFNLILRQKFTYYGVILDKNLANKNTDVWSAKEIYLDISIKLCKSAEASLGRAKIVFDKTGNRDFLNQLSKNIKLNLNAREYKVGKILMQKSHSNNLLQVADYVAGMLYRSVLGKDRDNYRRKLKDKERIIRLI